MTFDYSDRIEPAKNIIVLDLGGEASTLYRIADQSQQPSHRLALGVDALVRQSLRHEPAWPIEIEHAIDVTEEAVMPIAAQLSHADELHTQGLGGAIIGTSLQASGMFQSVYTVQEVEALFNRLIAVSQGRPMSQDNLPTDVRFVGAVLIVREVMHHLGVPLLVLPSTSPPISA